MRRFSEIIVNVLKGVVRPARAIARASYAALRASLSQQSGAAPERSYSFSRDLFLRGLGIILFAAFLSAWVQVAGLIGSDGILPLDESLKGVAANYGLRRFFLLPTLFWLDASDAALQVACGTGCLASLLLVLGVAPLPCLFVDWTLYLSLVTGGAEFFNYQWDFLLLETSFAALFLAPAWRLNSSRRPSPPSALRFLFLWILFRVVFFSGLFKLLGGDPSWGALKALRFFFQCQTLPTPLSWWAQQAPEWALQAVCLGTLLVELGVPLLMFLHRRLRLVSFLVLVAYQAAIMAFGNYNFFNLTVMLLALFLLDDSFWLQKKRWLPFLAPSQIPSPGAANRGPLKEGGGPPPPQSRIRWEILPYFLFVVLVTGVFLVSDLGYKGDWPKPLLWPYRLNLPLRLTGHYGYMLTSVDYRREIVVEGSADGKTWKEYGFRWKPGDVRRLPGFASPHQPRLDAQMWMAAFGTCEDAPWFQQFMGRLLTGSKPVLSLLKENPFPGSPPRFVRARLYDYRFTEFGEWWKTGEWWVRIERGDFCPAISMPEKTEHSSSGGNSAATPNTH